MVEPTPAPHTPAHPEPAASAATTSALPAAAEPSAAPELERDLFVVIRLTAAIKGGSTVPAEVVVTRCATFDAAKDAARRTRSEHVPDSTEEVWWEIRRPGGQAMWMVHAWAPREYDLDVDSGRAAPSSKG